MHDMIFSIKKEPPHEHEEVPEPKTKIYETFYEQCKFSNGELWMYIVSRRKNTTIL